MRQLVRIAVVVTMVGALTPAVGPVPTASAAGAGGFGSTDFNGDGYDELVIAVPSESVGAIQDAGAVTVMFGSAAGVTTAGSQLWSQASPGLAGNPQTGDRFGESWTAGDFDDDGYDDLAIGIPGDNVRGAVDSGRVQLLHGGPNGLTARNQQLFGSKNLPAAGRFGAALAAADFNADGATDLAVGAPGVAVGGDAGAGAVYVYSGSQSVGLRLAKGAVYTQDRPGIAGAAEPGDAFGSALAAGRVGYNRRADLVVGVPREDLPGAADAGVVQVLHGGPSGLDPATDQLFDLHDIEPSSTTSYIAVDTLSADTGDRFGTSVAIAQQAGTRRPIVVAGAPFDDDPNGDLDADIGSIAIFIGSAGGPLEVVGGNAPNQNDDEQDIGPGRQFGRSLAGLGVHGWVVGIPGMPTNGADRSGQVRVYSWTVDEGGGGVEGGVYVRQFLVGETSEVDDEFGAAVWAANVDGEAAPEYAIASRESFEDEGVEQGGLVIVGPVGSSDVQQFSQSTPGVPETNEDFDRFGVQLVP